MEFNFGAHSLIFACYAPGLCGFRGIFLKQCLLSPVGVLKAGRKS